MWSYYGSKSKIINKYPSPRYQTIIEPFAGSARYAYKYWENKIILYDKFPDIINIWKHLQKSTINDILSLPDVEYKEDIRKYTQLCDEEKLLIGFCINRGSATRRNIAQKFNSWNTDKIRIANDLYKIRHWEITLGSYDEIDNSLCATWFIDPPYQYGGDSYKFSNKDINYKNLSDWCEKLNGQIIVCENDKANWMDFKPLSSLQGQRHKTIESIWYKEC